MFVRGLHAPCLIQVVRLGQAKELDCLSYSQKLFRLSAYKKLTESLDFKFKAEV